MSDILGVLKPCGRLLCFEIKTGKAKQSEEQVRWEHLAVRYGAFYRVIMSLDDLYKAIKDAQTGA